MSYLLTTQQFADEMNAHLPPGAPSITPRKVSTWTECGLIRDFSTTKRAGFRPKDIEAFICSHPYRVLPFEYLRVSLVEIRDDPIPALCGDAEDATKKPDYRTHAGYDGLNRLCLSPKMARRAITSIWPVAESKAKDLAARGVPLIGTVKGIVQPDMVYTIINCTRFQGRTIFHTRSVEEKVRATIGTGALIDVPGGQIWGIVTQAQPPSSAT
jgi:hypothetical protein